MVMVLIVRFHIATLDIYASTYRNNPLRANNKNAGGGTQSVVASCFEDRGLLFAFLREYTGQIEVSSFRSP